MAVKAFDITDEIKSYLQITSQGRMGGGDDATAGPEKPNVFQFDYPPVDTDAPDFLLQEYYRNSTMRKDTLSANN